MAAATTQQRRPVSIFTTHVTDDRVELVVTGKHGTLTIGFHAEEPTIDFPDWVRGEGKYKAVCDLSANGEVVGWFVEKKGETAKDDTMVFFPFSQRRRLAAENSTAKPPQKHPARASRKTKKGGK